MKKVLSIIILFSSLAYAYIASAASYLDRLWPGGVIYYKIDSSMGPITISNFIAAVGHYESKTLLRFHDVDTMTNPPSRANYILVTEESSRTRSEARIGTTYCGFYVGSTCWGWANPIIWFSPEASTETAIHEIFHTIGFKHEQASLNRDSFVDFDARELASSEISSNYAKSGLTVGIYNYGSVSHYNHPSLTKRLSITESYDDILKPVSFLRRYRLRFYDPASASDPDVADINEYKALNNESNNAVVSATVPLTGWASAFWEITPTGSSGYVTIGNLKNHPAIQLLYDDSPNSASPKLSSSIAASAQKAQWRFVADGSYFKLQNRATGRYLNLGSGNLQLQSGSSNSKWLIQPLVDADRSELHPLDKLAIHIIYDRLFRIKLVDSSSTILDNETVHTQYGGLDVEQLPLDSDSENYWHSAMWRLQPFYWEGVNYIRIINHDGEKLLHNEYGDLEVTTLNSTNQGWHKGHWILEFNEDDGSFRIRNRQDGTYLYKNINGVLELTDTPTPLDSHWFLHPVDWDNYENEL